jgi:hypothetical protein
LSCNNLDRFLEERGTFKGPNLNVGLYITIIIVNSVVRPCKLMWRLYGQVVYGGLDTLELIGRRTMDVLQETDPGLRAKKDRILQRVKKPNLSAVSFILLYCFFIIDVIR